MQEKLRRLIKTYNIEKLNYNPKTNEKGEFLYIPNMNKIDKSIIEEIKINKADILIEIAEIKKEKEEEFNLEVKNAMKAKIIGLTYIFGCDCADTKTFAYGLPDNFNFNAKHERIKKDEKLLNEISHIINKDLVDKIGYKKEIDSGNYSYGGWEFDKQQTAKIIEIAQEKIDKKEKETNKKEQEEKERVEKIFAEAKETGKKQILSKWMADCNDEDLDCSFDSIIKYANPNGTTSIERIHCY